MNRTRVQGLVLVNWRGVFYARYDLDSHVTALEGANGAGKTTVMIGAYIVLLPDLQRLRFTNLGESGSSGGDRGIYGRLGEPGAPSYALLDLKTARGERLVAGVHLERRTEPTVELTPFIITDLDARHSLQDVLLERGEVDAVAELARVRELVALCGGKLTAFRATKDYFAALFDRGITPLRLSSPEELTKFNEMLRTSMVGGISKTLTGGLRDFLLREENTLADTLKRMKANLVACQRTRQQVHEARRLEEEIHGVYEAGSAMFVAAFHATARRAQELAVRLDDARKELERVQADFDELQTVVEQRRSEAEALTASLDTARQSVERLRELRERTRKAFGIDQRILALEEQRRGLALELEGAVRARDIAQDAFDRARQEVSRADQERDRAARGLADFNAGFEELNLQAAAYALVTRRLAQARDALGEELAPEDADAREALLREEIATFDATIVRLERELSTAHEHARQFGAVFEVLARLLDAELRPETAYTQAGAALEALRELDALAKERGQLGEEIARLDEQAGRQQKAFDTARQLSTLERPLLDAAAVREAFDAADALRSQHEVRLAEHANGARDARARADELTRRATELDALVGPWQATQHVATRLAARWDLQLRTNADVLAMIDAASASRETLAATLRKSDGQYDALRTEARQLEQMGGHFDDALVRARDVVDGELLAVRFEDVEIEHAAEIEARLGALHQAILVEDVAAAARKLAATELRPSTVWLVGEGQTLGLDDGGRPPGERIVDDVLVEDRAAWRLSRIPKQPTIGRSARAKRIAQLDAEASAVEAERDGLRQRLHTLDADLKSARELLGAAHLLERDDPRAALEATRAELEGAERERQEHTRLEHHHRQQLAELEPRRAALGRLLELAWLLDEPDVASRLEASRTRLDQAHKAAARITACTEDRRRLAAEIEVLRTLPPRDEELAGHSVALHNATAERDRLSQATQWLAHVAAHTHAFAWHSAHEQLAREERLAPALQENLERAEQGCTNARQAESTAGHRLEDARSTAANHTAELNARDSTLAREREELAGLAIDDPSAAAVQGVEAAFDKASDEAARLDREGRALEVALATLDERLRAEGERLDTRRRLVENEENMWRPSEERWQRLRARAEQEGVLANATNVASLAAVADKAGVHLWPQAQNKHATLRARLESTRDGAELIAAIDALIAHDGEQERGEAYLEAWLAVQAWLRRRVPAQISEVDDPLEALRRLRSHLMELEERLGRQEHELRGQSSDIARNIDTQIRKAHRVVRRLSKDLEQVSFGSIRSVRIRVERVERMEQVLRALRDGSAQQLLFQTDVPIEQALDELFRRYGGGRTGGDRMLDYREYMQLEVEVHRQAAVTWERANPNRMSTGEAIGVGAAVMMIVLTAWERDANLFRSSSAGGTLRLLFLDEATRLSQDSLTVLFDLCQSLELQLLIAAPEVAQAVGNTTYRLVRTLDAEGRERVEVTGRRTIADPEPA
ncbi:MAG: chromosome partition protein MukB [Bradymonadaceae bacterium]|nr:chromosome partition protein MukB [Lujinxingiaceae bacterium]